ncbi:MAG: universal stress protein [Proteobacteria bacterium]|nr:universal stress protein [Pseudomonadota bacterium]
MRSILVLADRTAASPARLETALSLARAYDGHLSVLIDTPVARYMSVDAMGGSYIAADAIREALERDDVFAAEIKERLAREDVPFDVMRGEEEPVDALLECVRLSDLLVLSHGCDFAGEVAISAHVPVLLVPPAAGAGGLAVPFERACVGWDGGEAAAVALRAAIPVLARASEVHVITVAEKSGGYPSTEALAYLSRHGIKAELHEESRVGSTEETLAATVARLQGQLLVMGAYGRSRMREFLFGGVTRYFLTEPRAPALLMAR